MNLIIWRVSRRNSTLLLLGTVFTALLSHLCCIGPAIFMSLGLSGATIVLEQTVGQLKTFLTALSIVLLGLTGWKIYTNPNSHLIEKVSFWISVLIVAVVLFLK